MGDLIFFGAGASFGSEPSGMPPLGAALFDSLRQFNPDGWGKIIDPLAKKFRADFEAGMVELSTSQPHALPPLQRAMAAFFFGFAPTGRSLYVELAQRIRTRSWTGALATLNYERLLELALSRVGMQAVVNMTPRSKAQIELCLPHGCCHLFCEGARGKAFAVSFSGINVTTNGPVISISEANGFLERIQTDAFPPVMSYFEPQKRTTAGANLIATQRQRFGQLCANAARIAVVGIHPRSHDSHVWGPLQTSKAKLIYCGGPMGASAFEAWCKSIGRTGDVVLPGFFAAEFDNLCTSIGL